MGRPGQGPDRQAVLLTRWGRRERPGLQEFAVEVRVSFELGEDRLPEATAGGHLAVVPRLDPRRVDLADRLAHHREPFPAMPPRGLAGSNAAGHGYAESGPVVVDDVAVDGKPQGMRVDPVRTHYRSPRCSGSL